MEDNWKLITPFDSEEEPRIYEAVYPSGNQYAVFNEFGLVEICKSKADAYAVASQFLQN